MQAKKQRGLNKTIIILLSLEAFVALCEIALAVYYIIGGDGFIISPSSPIQMTSVALMAALYVLILGVLLLCVLVFSKPSFENKRKLCSIVILTIECILVIYLLYTVVYNLASKPNDAYFLLSLSWNIPRIIISTSLLICAVAYHSRKESSSHIK
jgi:flagellar basal body-associated protein FliL